MLLRGDRHDKRAVRAKRAGSRCTRVVEEEARARSGERAVTRAAGGGRGDRGAQERQCREQGRRGQTRAPHRDVHGNRKARRVQGAARVPYCSRGDRGGLSERVLLVDVAQQPLQCAKTGASQPRRPDRRCARVFQQARSRAPPHAILKWRDQRPLPEPETKSDPEARINVAAGLSSPVLSSG